MIPLAKHMTIAARYENGVFKPLEDVKIKEGAVVRVYVPQGEKARPRSIRNLGFAGMWKDRDDITDGVSYVNRLRNNPRS
jgi:predicted DNA-binding antitoxin AbrB/MazE fold protein